MDMVICFNDLSWMNLLEDRNFILALLWQIFEVHDIFGIPEIHIA